VLFVSDSPIALLDAVAINRWASSIDCFVSCNGLALLINRLKFSSFGLNREVSRQCEGGSVDTGIADSKNGLRSASGSCCRCDWTTNIAACKARGDDSLM